MEIKKNHMYSFAMSREGLRVDFPRGVYWDVEKAKHFGLFEGFFRVIEAVANAWKEDLQEKDRIISNITELKYIRAEQLMKKLFHSGYLKTAYGQIVSCGTNDSASYPLTEEDTEWLVKHFMEESE